MKQFLATLLVALMIISTFLPVLADQPEISLHLFGEKVESDVAPVIINDRTLVPARALFEAMGAQVIWNGIKKQVHISRENISILLTLNSTTVQVNGEKKTLDVPAQLVNDRTLVPVRFVSETLDFDVRWDQPTRTVYIDRKEPELATFDKITAKSSRKRMVSIKCSKAEKYGEYKGQPAPTSVKQTYNFCNPDSEGQMYMIAESRGEGTVMIIFAPDERIREAIEKYIPRTAR